MTKPYSIKIFLPGGDPDGVRLIEKSNWSGVGLVVPRALFAEAKTRKELSRTGVYVLVGPAEDSGLQRVYVGEGDPIRPRLEQHASKKDFWTTCIGFTSKDENLNKAHVQHLEARLIELATEAKRCKLDNGNTPTRPSMSEADAADADGFLSEMLLCFPVLGISAFAKPEAVAAPGNMLRLDSKGIVAHGALTPDGFAVFAGSAAVLNEQPSCHEFMRALRASLIGNGVFKPNGNAFTLTQDYVFASPSTAAGVLLGRPANGRTEWKTKSGKTLKELQESQGGV
jgi:hypothetical protein